MPILHPRALRELATEQAAFLVAPELAPRLPEGRRWIHDHPRWTLARLLQQGAQPLEPSISPHAIVEPGAIVGPNTHVGHGAVLLDGARTGRDCRIEPRAVLYGGVRLGDRVFVGAGAVIGRPGFGWTEGPEGEVLRMPQRAGVTIEDDVEIGPLATIDAGTLKPTRLRRGCKLDAQVHVGHNVELGELTMVAAQTGFAGSVTVGRNVLIGGQVGVADHATIGDHARLAGRSGVIGPIPAHATVAGYPAVDRLRWLRAIARMMRGRS
ncbi:MAG: UDP-3-O-(3-hydroxymyristoyl)glucosamine N-acyltransferase [Myxococcota bacterium]